MSVCRQGDESNMSEMVGAFLALSAEVQQDIIDLLRCLALTE